MNIFDKNYKLIMQDVQQEFFNLPYPEQRDRVISSLEQGAPVLWQSLQQFDLTILLLYFSNVWDKYKYDDWNFDTAKEYAKQLKYDIASGKVEFPSNINAVPGGLTWGDIANEVWDYYKV